MTKKNIARPDLFLLIVLIFSCFCCTRGDEILLVKTRYNIYDFEYSNQAAKDLKQICSSNQLDFRYYLLDADMSSKEALVELRQQIENAAVKYILIDPVLNIPIDSVVMQFPAKLFISFRQMVNRNFANLALVQYKKTAALQIAGRICSILLRQKHPKLAEKQAPGEKLKLGILVSREDPQWEGINLIRAEFRQEYNEEDLLTEEVRNIQDRSEINRKIEKLIGSGAVLVFPRLAVSNAHCLETVTKKGGVVILENWRFSGSQNDTNILFSIDNPFPAAVREIVLAAPVPGEGDPVWNSALIEVPSAITWGGVMEIPAEIESILEK